MTRLTRCFDASEQIPEKAPEGCEAVLGYIGPDPEAAHVWTLAEWLRFSHLHQFPCWLAQPSKPAADQAAEAVKAAAALGWHKGRVIVCDMETADDPAWWDTWSATVREHGYRPAWYGSLGNAGKYDADLKWLALYDNLESIPDGYAAKQYQANAAVPGGVVDFSVVGPQLLKHAGVGPRRAA